MNHVSINPQLFEWAQHRARLDVRVLRKAKDFAQYEDWLTGKSKPTIRQLEKFAKKTLTPLGYFFLPSPPKEELPIPDFRTLADETIAEPSVNLLETIQIMRRRQEWMRDYLIDLGQEPLKFVGVVNLKHKPSDVAALIRKELDLRADWARVCPNWETALRTLRSAIEEARILNFSDGIVAHNTRRRLDVAEFRGFVLIDVHAPLIFVNSADAPAAQMFTLVHELAHVWIGKEGVSNLPHLLAGNVEVEKFCNQVAADFLTPAAEFRLAWREARENTRPFESLAKRFKVSPLVTARRALDLGCITESEFFAFYGMYMDGFHKRKEEPRADEYAGGPSFYTNQTARLDGRFVASVIRSAKEGRLLYQNAYELIGMHGRTFSEFARRNGLQS